MEYRFFLYIYSLAEEHEVTPLGLSDYSFVYEKQEGQLFYRRIFKGELVFKDFDWGYFKVPYDADDYCDNFDLIIEKRCSDTDLWVADWLGTFSLMNGRFDFNKCTYKVTPLVVDKYSTIIRNGDIRKNILTTFTDITSHVKSKIEIQGCFDTGFITCTTCIITPLQSMSEWIIGGPILIGVPPACDAYMRLYAREAILLPTGFDPNIHSSGWIQWNGNDNIAYWSFKNEYLEPNSNQTKWVRAWTNQLAAPAQTDIFFSIVPASALGDNYVDLTGDIVSDYVLYSANYVIAKKTYYQGHFNVDVQLPYRCYNLVDTLKFLTGTTTVDSDFLNNATNPVTGVASKTNHLYLIQNSDAKRPTATNPATKGEISFNELAEWLKNTFQIYWDIDTDGHLQIIHISEKLFAAGLSLANYPTAANKLELEFDVNSLYEQEKITMAISDGEDFEGLPIYYDIDCVSTDKEANIQDYINGLITDLPYIQTKTDDIPDEGFTLVATDGTAVLIETGELSGTSQINGHLSTANLMHNYWQHERVLISGTMNGVATTFETAKKTKIFNEVKIQLCCETDFNPEELVTTALGDGRIKGAEYKLNTGKLTLNLLL